MELKSALSHNGTTGNLNQQLVALCFGIVFVLLGFLIATNLLLPIVALFGVLFGIVFIGNSKLGLYVLIAGLFSLEYIASFEIIPKAATLIPELLVAALAIRFLGLLALGRVTWQGSVPHIDFWVIFILLICFFTAIYNAQSPITTVFGLRAYFKYILLFYLVLNLNLTLAELKSIWTFLWALVSLQPFIVFLQFWAQGLTGGAPGVDLNGGTMAVAHGGTGVLSVVAGMSSALALGFYFERKNKAYVILAVLMALSLGMADAKGGFFFIAASVVAWFIFYVLGNNIKMLRRLVFPVILMLFGFYLTASLATHLLRIDILGLFEEVNVIYEIPEGKLDLISTMRDSEKTFLKQEELGLHSSYISRIADMQFAIQYLSKLPLQGIMGKGPASANPISIEAYSGEVYQKMSKRFGTGHIFFLQFSNTLIELGIVGIASFTGLFISLLFMARRFYHQLQSSYMRSLAISFYGFIVVVVASYFYHAVWFMEVPIFIFWFAAAMLVRGVREQKLHMKSVDG